MKQLAGQADVQRRLECLLEALRGAAGGVTPGTQVSVMEQPHLGDCLQCEQSQTT